MHAMGANESNHQCSDKSKQITGIAEGQGHRQNSTAQRTLQQMD